MESISLTRAPPRIVPIHTMNAHRPSIGSNPPSPPSIYPQPFTPSEPGSDELGHYSAYPPSPALPPDFTRLDPIHHSYPPSPVFPSGIPLPAFSCPAPPEPCLEREPAFFNDRNFLPPLPPQPLYHQWPCYPSATYHNEPTAVLQQNQPTLYTPTYLPPTFNPQFSYPAQEEFLGRSTEIDTFKPILVPNYNTVDINHQNNNIHRPSSSLLLTPSPPPSPFLQTTTTRTTMNHHQNKPKQTTKSPPIPRSKKKKPSKLSSGLPRICKGCNATDTPEWRSGPTGERNYCNACGLRWKKALKSAKVAVNKAWGVGNVNSSSGKEIGMGSGNLGGVDQSIKIKLENVC